MRAEIFFDSNIILYLLDEGPKADAAASALKGGGIISVQVLNEVLANCLRKGGMSWAEAGVFLAGIRGICNVVDLTTEIHDVGRAVGQRYGLSSYDSMIVAAALVGGCTVLYSDDMHDGLLVEDALRIVDPFRV